MAPGGLKSQTKAPGHAAEKKEASESERKKKSGLSRGGISELNQSVSSLE